MSEVIILHNTQCSTSRAALDVAIGAHAEVAIINYLREPLDAQALGELLDQLQDPETDLVRRDSFFKAQGLTEDDVATREQIIQVLLAHPRLMQRPVLVKNGTAIIGRPKDRVPEFLRS